MTSVAISGGGPAGMMLGLLLARAGIKVTVLEKHGDFLRDFRGDTVHASTIRLLDELGLGKGFRELPQSTLGNLSAPMPDGGRVTLTDFDRLPKPYNYIAMVPQWDLLDFLAAAAKREPTFTLRMNTEVTGLIRERGRVVGVHTTDGELRADLVVACDGRHSVLREERPKEFRVPFDTWWLRLPRHEEEREQIATLRAEFRGKEIAVCFTRDTFYQVAYFNLKGMDAQIRAEGVQRFRERISGLLPQFADRVDQIESMDDVKVLDVRLNRLRRWYSDGLLLIGDAAHAMSPAGGVGINLAIQDAVAAATLLARPLRRGRVTVGDLARVQRRRRLPTVLVQAVQLVLHRALFAAAFEGKRSGPPRSVVFLIRHVPGFRQIPSRMIAYGPRPEHAPAFARR